MAHGMDRLEKIFLRRKHASSRRASAADEAAPLQPAAAVGRLPPIKFGEKAEFPAPSFIKPTTTRMVARNEFDTDSSRSSSRRPSLTGSNRTSDDRQRQSAAPLSPEIPDRTASLKANHLTAARSRAGSEAKTAFGRAHSLPELCPSLSRLSIGPDSILSSCFAESRASVSPGREGAAGNRSPLRRQNSSLLGRRDTTLASLDAFKFCTSQSSGSSSNSSRTPSPREPPSPQRSNVRIVPDMASALAARLDTPPLSDLEEDPLGCHPVIRRKPSLPLPLRSQPTPETSPVLKPSVCPRLPSPKLGPPIELRPLVQRGSMDSLVSRQPTLRRTMSESSLAPRFRRSARHVNPVLQAPEVYDFLSLSDEDIAESRPSSPDGSEADEFPIESCILEEDEDTAAWVEEQSQSPRKAALSPPAPVTPTNIVSKTGESPRTPSFQVSPGQPPRTMPPPLPRLTTSPPTFPTPALSRELAPESCGAALMEQAATAAAFEAARIAARYSFDLVYVVNLWPKGMACLHEPNLWSDTGSPKVPRHAALAGQGIPVVMEAGTKTMARFLAAYGLADLRTPLLLNESVHTTILNAGVWIEHQNQLGAGEASSTGYGRAFCSSYTPTVSTTEAGEGSSADSETEYDSDSTLPRSANRHRNAGDRTSTPRPAEPATVMNGGIVFMGYRRPQPMATATTPTPTQASASPLSAMAKTNKALKCPLSDEQELASLERDAKGLVDMILDFHQWHRRREQLAKLRAATGSGVTEAAPGSPTKAGRRA